MLSNSNPLPKVHCLVHPGFDYGDHPEFEESVRCYIDHIAYKTNDILLIVSDGESLDNEQRRQWSHIQMLDGIGVFLLLYEPLAGHLLETYDYRGCYSKALINNDLDEKLYNWCKENIDITQLEEITGSMKILRENKRIRDHGFDINNYNLEKDKLCKQWEFFLTTINISSLAQKASDDLGAPDIPIKTTPRVIGNRPRFFRIYQHAMRVLGKDRMREIFISDSEDSILPPEPVITSKYVLNFREILMNQLAMSRYDGLIKRQPISIFNDMNFKVTPQTTFIFLGEYRGRCVDNVLKVMHTRLQGIAGNNFFVADNSLTLVREDDLLSTKK